MQYVTTHVTEFPCPCCGINTCCCPDRTLPPRLNLTMTGPPGTMGACNCLTDVTLPLTFRATKDHGGGIELNIWSTDSYVCTTAFGCAIRVQFFLTCGDTVKGAPFQDPGDLIEFLDVALFDAMVEDGGGLSNNPQCPDPDPGPPCKWVLSAYVARTPDGGEFCGGCGSDWNLGWQNCQLAFGPEGYSCDPIDINFTFDIVASGCDPDSACTIGVQITEPV
jgi:hypothetical protein